jgi:FKBP-type peptidyl-prolyl cis-trans isomerase
MNVYRFVVLALAAVGSLVMAQESEFKTAKEKVSYGFGLNVGRSMIRDGLLRDDLDFKILVQGLRDALEEKELKITEKEFTEAFNAVIAPKLAERAKAAAEKSKQEGEEFLAANKGKKGVKTTASGLQYKVLKSGSGKSPKATDKVRTMYSGAFIDGTVFDKSEKPIDFPVSRVIKGWTEALQLMKEGDTFQLFIPSDLAYGEEGSPPSIPPNAALVFEVELLEVLLPGSSPPPNKPNLTKPTAADPTDPTKPKPKPKSP